MNEPPLSPIDDVLPQLVEVAESLQRIQQRLSKMFGELQTETPAVAHAASEVHQAFDAARAAYRATKLCQFHVCQSEMPPGESLPRPPM